MLCNITHNAMGQTPGGLPISHNALQHYPECHGADTGGYPARSGQGYPSGEGGTQVGSPQPPPPGQDGGYPAGGDTQVGHPPAGYPPGPGQDGGVPS